jgi:prephenate dehydrogenase
MFNQLGVIGCGLMGGSFALALKRAGLVKRVVGYSKSPSTTDLAKRLGVIDVAAESALLAVSGSDIVLVAVPVAATEATFGAIRHGIKDGMLVMDVGSTKRDVVDTARRVLREKVVNFVPAHPIAGSEQSGVAHADAALYNTRQVIVTPLPQTQPDLVQKATDVWTAIGAQVLRITCRTCWRLPVSRRSPTSLPGGITCRWPARVSATSPASPPAIRRSGATSCWPTARRCSSRASASA